MEPGGSLSGKNQSNVVPSMSVLVGGTKLHVVPCPFLFFREVRTITLYRQSGWVITLVHRSLRGTECLVCSFNRREVLFLHCPIVLFAKQVMTGRILYRIFSSMSLSSYPFVSEKVVDDLERVYWHKVPVTLWPSLWSGTESYSLNYF